SFCWRCGTSDAEPRAAVAPGPDRLPPPAVIEIPGDRIAQPGLEGMAGLPAQFAADFRGVDRIAPVVAGPVRDKSDQLRVRPMRRARPELVEQPADCNHDLKIGALAVA